MSTDEFNYAEHFSQEVRNWVDEHAPNERNGYAEFGEHFRKCPPSEYLKMQDDLKQRMLKESIAFGRERDEAIHSALRIYRNIKEVQARQLEEPRIPFTHDNWRDIGGFE